MFVAIVHVVVIIVRSTTIRQVNYSKSFAKTRKLSYHNDDRAMHPVYESLDEKLMMLLPTDRLKVEIRRQKSGKIYNNNTRRKNKISFH